MDVEARFDPFSRRWVRFHPSVQPFHLPRFTTPLAASSPEACSLCQHTRSPIYQRSLSQGAPVQVFTHQHPLLRLEASPQRTAQGPYATQAGFGAHEVIAEPNHQGDWLSYSLPVLADVLLTLRDRARDLLKDRRLHQLDLLRKDASQGEATSHPHSLLLASATYPFQLGPLSEARRYYAQHHRCLRCDALQFEAQSPRLVLEDSFFFAYCPYASGHPFELHLTPKTHQAHFSALTREEALALARMLQTLGQALQHTLGPVPLQLEGTLGFASQAYDVLAHESADLAVVWHWSLSLKPQVLISPTEAQAFTPCPTLPEQSAEALRLAIGQLSP